MSSDGTNVVEFRGLILERLQEAEAGLSLQQGVCLTVINNEMVLKTLLFQEY